MLEPDEEVLNILKEEGSKVVGEGDPKPTEGDPPPAADPEPAKGGDPPADPVGTGDPDPKPADPPVEGDPPPAADPPPEPSKPESSAEQTQAIIDQYLSETSGGVFKSATEFEEAKVFDTIATVPDLTEKLQGLEENKVEFASDFVKGLNDYIGKGGINPALFLELQKMDVKEMEPTEVLKTHMRLTNQGLTEQNIEQYLVNKYKQFDKESEDYEEKEFTQGKVEMTIDSNSAREKLTEMQHEIKTPEPEKVRQQQETVETERLQKWDPVISQEVTDFKKITIPLNDKDVKFDYEIKPEHRQGLIDAAKEAVEYSRVEYDNNGAQTVQQILTNRYIVDNFQDIAKSIAEKARSLNDEEWIIETSNPSGANKDDQPPPDPAGSKDLVDQILEFEQQQS